MTDPVNPVPPPPWHRTRLGALVLSGGGFLSYLFIGQGVPAVLVGIHLALNGQGPPTEEEVFRLIAPYLALITAWTLLVAAALVFFLRLTGWLHPPPRPSASRKCLVLVLLLVPIACLAGQAAIGQVQKWLGIPMEEQPIVLQAIESQGLAFLFVGVILGPIGEEIFFRRFLFTTLRSTWGGRVTAYVLTALLFAAIHFHPVGTLFYVWMACCFGYAYERTGSLATAIGVHAINNAFAILPRMLIPE